MSQTPTAPGKFGSGRFHRPNPYGGSSVTGVMSMPFGSQNNSNSAAPNSARKTPHSRQGSSADPGSDSETLTTVSNDNFSARLNEITKGGPPAFDYENEIKKEEVLKETNRELFEFPKDDIKEVELPREFRTELDPEIKDWQHARDKEKLLPHVKDCVEFYLTRWRGYTRTHADLGLKARSESDSGLTSLLYEDSNEESQQESSTGASTSGGPSSSGLGASSGRDVVRTDLLESYKPKTTDALNEKNRLLGRHELYQLSPAADAAVVNERVPPFKPKPIRRFLIEPKELKFELGNVEPYFCTMALYDISKKVRISENYYYELNGSEVSDMLGEHRVKTKPCKRALFSVSSPSPDIFVVVRIEKVLHGDYDESVESYVKFDNVKDKDREKIERDVKERCARLGQWRQPFCVGILPLFNAEDRSMSVITSGNKEHPHQLTMKNIYRYRGDVGDLAFFEQMPEKGSSSSKKMKPLNGYMTLEVRELAQSDVAANTNAKPANMQEVLVSPCSLPVHPDVKVPSSEYIQEVQEFPQTLTAFPNLEYVNNLYLYPEMVNLTKTNGQKSARNIAVSVQFLETDDVNSKLRALWNKNSAEPEMSDHVFTAVQYHNKSPQFYDEIKIKLPLHLTPRHNLLFTFYHVPCQLKKPSEPTIVGYAFIPIMVKGRIMEKEIQIPIASELPNKFLSKEASEAIKAGLIDSKKITFKFRLRLVSTVHASDKHVNQFFVDNKKHKLDRTALATSLAQLTKAKPRVVIQFMPVLFTQLLQLIAQGSELSREALHVLITLIASMHNESLDSKTFLEKYVEHVFVDPKKSEASNSTEESGWVYYELLKQWLSVLKEKTSALPSGAIAASASMTVQSSDKNSTPANMNELERYYKYSWFLFKLIYKSMCDRLSALHLLQDQTTRSKRFGAECERSVRALCVLLAYQIQTHLKKTLSVFKDLNRSLAHYLGDMLAVMDRGVVLEVMQHVIKELSPSTTEPQLQLLDVKLEHIKILVLHEHWIELNLPRHHALTVTNLPKLLELYSQRHVLAGVVLRAVFELSINHDKPLRLKALAVLHLLFMRHDHDSRYNKRGVKQRIAELYFPFVLHVIDNLAFYREADFDEQRSAFLLWCYIVKNCSAQLMRDWWKMDTVTRLVGFLTALSFAARVFEHVGRETYLEKMNRESESKSSVMAMFEEKYQDQPTESESRNKSLRERRIEARSRGNTVGSGTAPSQNPTPGHTPQPSTSGVSVSASQSGSIKDPKRWRASYASEVDKRFDYNSERESHLSHEVSMILLDALESFVSAKESELVESHQPNLLLDQVFKVLKTSLKMKQSVTYLTHAYATLRTFVYKFPKALFTLNTQYCAKLCNLVLAHCNYNNNAVRSEASAIIYLFMKKNFEATKRKNFTRIKVATTIALSKLVGEGEVSDPAYLRRALDVLPEYVRADLKGSDAELENQAIQLVQRLKTILEDSVKSIRHAKNKDNEMLADLYHHIAQSYNNAPDLRVTWLKSLASLHEKNKAWAEAGIAVVHIAALIAEFLNLAEPSPGLPVGCAAFEHVSHSALEEVLESSGDLLGGVTDDEATTELQIFTEDGLVKVMCQAIEYLKQAELYEACNELYKLVLPIFEKNRDYLKLSAAHLDLKEIFDKIILSMQNESRFLGSYYRVAFFGNLFEELSGQEFIYKEPKLTRLGEISDRLVNLYQKKFCEGVKVQLLTTSADVDVSKLELDKQCYLQITSVDPYFEPWELKDRVTHYDRSYNISSFIFETPFTKDGKQQSGDLSRQYKRKTILQVETAFPYMKTRLRITKKHSVELAPIENALETVEKRIQKLQNELRNPNTKTLMGVLQGTVSPQVHAGSTEVAKAFLSESSKGQYDTEQVESIRRALQEFLEVCADALNRSSQLINPEQIPFQKELEEGFKAMKAVMENYLSSK